MSLKAHWKQLLVVALLLVAGLAFAQSQIARFFYEDAEAAFAKKDYRTALTRLDEAQAKLGKINPPILYLRIMVHSAMVGDRPAQNMELLDSLREETAQFLRDYGELEQLRDQARDVFRISNRLKEMPTREQLAQQRRQQEARREAEAERKREELAARSKPGSVSRDCPECPEMIVVPGGKFVMGATDADPADWDFAKPAHEVTVQTFEIGRYEVTQAQWKAVMGTVSSHQQTCGTCAVHWVSWDAVQGYLSRLNRMTGSNYRLPTEAEWEYAARAGTTTRFFWGNDVGTNKANCGGCGNDTDAVFRQRVNSVGTFAPNAFGLFDMHGNAAEWVEDIFQPNYVGAPTDGSAWKQPSTAGKGDLRTARGGHFAIRPDGISAGFRQGFTRDFSGGGILGFRLARSLR